LFIEKLPDYYQINTQLQIKLKKSGLGVGMKEINSKKDLDIIWQYA